MTTENKMSPLEAARAAKAQREKDAQVRRDNAELACLNLEEKLTATCGEQGIDFEVVVAPDGTPIGLKRGDALVFQRFQKEGDLGEKAVDQFVTPCLEGISPEDYRSTVSKFPVVAIRCATALSSLFGSKSSDDLGKF